MRMIRAIWLGALLAVWATVALAEGKRVALVIGNAAYTSASALANPRNDARAIADKLRGIGFVVLHHEDLTGQSFRVALGEFSEQVLDADVALVFYAGHGIELNGQNYLIPVDAGMRSESTAQFEAIPLEQVLVAVRSAKKLGMVMLDACRDNPFSASMTRIGGGTRSASRGLAPVSVEGERGLVVSFAAEAGRTADDGDAMHSPYTQALLEVIDQPGVEVGRMFRTVRAKVREASGGKQVPIEQAQLPDEDVYLVAASSALGTAPATAPVPAVTPAPAPTPKPQVEDPLLVYLSAVQRQDMPALEDFIRRYPDHVRANDARAIVQDMVDQQFWTQTTADGSEAAYRRYLLAFPQGRFAADAEAGLVALRPAPVPLAALQPYTPPKQADVGTCPALDGDHVVNGVAADDTLFVRAGPGTGNAVVGELAFNAAGIFVTGCANKWCQVQHGCLEGYASQKYMTVGGAFQESPETGIYQVVDHPSDTKLNIRSGPGTSYPVVSELPHDATDVIVTDCDNQPGENFSWCALEWNNVVGWGYGRYLMGASGRKPGQAAAPATAGKSCFDLWYERNTIFDANGYCFGSAQGKQYFSNDGCFTSDPTLTAAEKAQVDAIKRLETAQGC